MATGSINSPVIIKGKRDLDRLKKWADRNLLKFTEGKYKVLNMGQNKLMEQGRLRADWLGGSFEEKDLTDNRLNRSQQ
ncbi:hypothetical protein QYF61_006436 [Mycteria americana]|uniref:Rna-directed dna polymerase from mobile element jockey-like n=1 Tax=Mycteria americana TaxID=33587 RepID=A0AAN7RVK4_MYCAM|nr:hypothetical protein QYF61_006436 [Mycteria americana]